ncbi:MAG: hypothetical protein RIC55_07615 [Pirellulaceae bacterium]
MLRRRWVLGWLATGLLLGCGGVVPGDGESGEATQAAEPLHPASIRSHVTDGGIGGGSSKMQGKLHNMNSSGRFKDGTDYRWNWKWTGVRDGKDVVKFHFELGDEDPIDREVVYGGGVEPVLDHPRLKVEIQPMTE